MPKAASFSYLYLTQVDYQGTTFVETSNFSIANDGTWIESYSTQGTTGGYVSVSGHLTTKELQTLSNLFARYEKNLLPNGPTTGPNLTDEDYYQLLGRGIHTEEDDPNTILADDRNMPSSYYGSSDFKAVETLNDYMLALSGKYGHGLLI